MRYTVTFSPESEADLLRIYWGITENGFPANAAAFTSALADFCYNLHTFPKRGLARNDLSQDLRHIGFRGQAHILFSIDDNKAVVTIQRILGRGQSIEKAFETD